jgi:hypothetical protein
LDKVELSLYGKNRCSRGSRGKSNGPSTQSKEKSG